ncbi:hypothetical protein [Acidipropionibacterium jensenii]|uniref:hypothetical protein n=1 Tax=Acidipropionibacterium jensenii TaxID=1749 RepID=UPI002647F1E0|nr:hypothetical protein [Acidipropionibacterium jensenii]MDN6618091.1 hypothetical protein [Corynebacterium variabile]MDN5976630.1 hypothetical protein [Acidipropionibacterium jensenii]MDN5995721.1 hypothetical protein [Acidipropionibacterium jensenii]MDN6021893.1 hypothetical protein [Acidipropionibacterium jensenii]MDN6426724.1 hypothetical protein [Acidipropionibacterium jensenii]
MARIRSFEPSAQDVKRHPTEVDCQYQSFLDNGVRLLHLSTFGSDHRTSRPKMSQSIQLDKQRAAELISIIKDAFPELTGC